MTLLTGHSSPDELTRRVARPGHRGSSGISEGRGNYVSYSSALLVKQCQTILIQSGVLPGENSVRVPREPSLHRA